MPNRLPVPHRNVSNHPASWIATTLAALMLFGAAQAEMAGYDPRETFAPVNFPDSVNRYRGLDGAPGPDFWQNRADYDIAARLDPASKSLTATETITYTNNSPSTLTSLWVQLDQNIYRPDARSAVALSHWHKASEITQGYAIESVQINDDGVAVSAPYLVTDTRMQVHLDRPLKELVEKLGRNAPARGARDAAFRACCLTSERFHRTKPQRYNLPPLNFAIILSA